MDFGIFGKPPKYLFRAGDRVILPPTVPYRIPQVVRGITEGTVVSKGGQTEIEEEDGRRAVWVKWDTWRKPMLVPGGALRVLVSPQKKTSGGLGALTADRIAEHFSVSPTVAVQIVNAIKNTAGDAEKVEEAMQAVNDILNANGVDTYGIEAIFGMWHGHYYQNIVADYINRGKTYAPTLVYNTVMERYALTSFGDWIEKWSKEYEIT